MQSTIERNGQIEGQNCCSKLYCHSINSNHAAATINYKKSITNLTTITNYDINISHIKNYTTNTNFR